MKSPVLNAILEQNEILKKIWEVCKNYSPEREEYVTVKQAAKLLKRSTRCIRGYIASGRLSAKKMNNTSQARYLISLRDIRNFVKNNDDFEK